MTTLYVVYEEESRNKSYRTEVAPEVADIDAPVSAEA